MSLVQAARDLLVLRELPAQHMVLQAFPRYFLVQEAEAALVGMAVLAEMGGLLVVVEVPEVQEAQEEMEEVFFISKLRNL